MAYQMNLIEIEGQRGTVPVLLTSEMIHLLKFRTENKINPENVHFFPGAVDSLKAMRGDAVLRKYTLQAGLKEPLAITGTQFYLIFFSSYVNVCFRFILLAIHQRTVAFSQCI